MNKSFKIVLILILISLFSVFIFRNALCRALITRAVKVSTGLNLSIKDSNLNIFSNSLRMQEVTLYNPADFRQKILGQAKEIFIKYKKPLNAIRGRLHLAKVKLNIGEINIIKNEKGDSNIAVFKKSKNRPNKVSDNQPAENRQNKKAEDKNKQGVQFIINNLEISLEKVNFIDYSAKIGETAVVVFSMKGPYVFHNVHNLKQVVNSISAKGGFNNLLNNLLK